MHTTAMQLPLSAGRHAAGLEEPRWSAGSTLVATASVLISLADRSWWPYHMEENGMFDIHTPSFSPDEELLAFCALTCRPHETFGLDVILVIDISTQAVKHRLLDVRFCNFLGRGQRAIAMVGFCRQIWDLGEALGICELRAPQPQNVLYIWVQDVCRAWAALPVYRRMILGKDSLPNNTTSSGMEATIGGCRMNMLPTIWIMHRLGSNSFSGGLQIRTLAAGHVQLAGHLGTLCMPCS